MRYLILTALLLPGTPALAALDDANYRVIKLEQDVRNLERQVQALSRQLDDVRMHLSRTGDRTALPERTPLSTDPGLWLDAAKWSRVKPGMEELDVVTLLGPPTSMRPEDGTRVLLYAIEIGSSGFLGGSVSVRDGKVVAVQKPTLK